MITLFNRGIPYQPSLVTVTGVVETNKSRFCVQRWPKNPHDPHAFFFAMRRIESRLEFVWENQRLAFTQRTTFLSNHPPLLKSLGRCCRANVCKNTKHAFYVGHVDIYKSIASSLQRGDLCDCVRFTGKQRIIGMIKDTHLQIMKHKVNMVKWIGCAKETYKQYN